MTAPPRQPQRSTEDAVPYGVRVAGAWSWRLLVVAGALALAVVIIARLKVIAIPLMVALLVTGLVRPLRERLRRWGVQRSVASLLTVFITLVVVAGLFTLVGQQIAQGFPALENDAFSGLSQVQHWLASGPFHITSDQLTGYLDKARAAVSGNKNNIADSVLGAAHAVVHVVAGFFLTIFAMYFFLNDGPRIWEWITGVLPRRSREPLDLAGHEGFSTITHYARGIVVVAVINALGVGIAAAILRVPLALPLAVLVFLGAFVPLLGTILAGLVTVLVALVAHGPIIAVIMLGALVGVHETEIHLLQPQLLGRAVRVHPLAVIIAIAAGALLAGAAGAVFAVPLLAVANTMIGAVVRYYRVPADPPPRLVEESSVNTR